ncbi:MAG TPA: NfeD family protein, partial [Anaerovoracaceae bacterium]|nr:NfeD family protein [Anaerovoracaceae bacterium]
MELFGYFISSSLIWIGVAVIFAIIETLTMGINTIWFAIGAVVASIVSMAGGSLLLQIIVFLIVSILLLYFTRPLAIKKLKIGNVKTNVDTLPGNTALVISDIIPYNTGQVKVMGQIWTAISAGTKDPMKQGETVRILRVEGVKLVVEPLTESDKM